MIDQHSQQTYGVAGLQGAAVIVWMINYHSFIHSLIHSFIAGVGHATLQRAAGSSS